MLCASWAVAQTAAPPPGTAVHPSTPPTGNATPPNAMTAPGTGYGNNTMATNTTASGAVNSATATAPAANPNPQYPPVNNPNPPPLNNPPPSVSPGH